MNNTLTTKKYDAKYDFAKLILSVLVLAIHACLYPMVLYPWLRLAVPLFFIMSSYFVFSKLRNASETDEKAIIKGFVVRNLQLYLCWFVILLPITLYIRKDVYLSGDVIKAIVNLVRNFLFGSTFFASWFITATVIGVLIVYFLNKVLKNNYILFVITLLAFCIVTLASSYTSVISGTFLSAAINKYTDIFGGLVCSYPAALFWVFIGKLFAEQKIRIKSTWLLIVLIITSAVGLFWEWKFVISLDGSYNNDSYFMLAPLCVLLFLGIQKIPPIYRNSSVHFKRTSTIIYVSHGSILIIVSDILALILKARYPLLSFVVTFLCCIVIYCFVEFVVRKCRIPQIKKLFKMLY